MNYFPYLIVGGGMTAAAAVEGIRSVDISGSIALFSLERHPPYNRPPLTKGLWKGKPLDKIWRKLDMEGFKMFLGRMIVSVDPVRKQVRDDLGDEFSYGKLLLATGGSPRKLPFGESSITYYRTLDDYQQVRELTSRPRKIVVIGGGFIGSEMAAALRSNGHQVVMVFPDDGIGGKQFPRDLSIFINDYYRKKGVEVLAGQVVREVRPVEKGVAISTGSGEEIVVDHVIAGIGIQPNTSLAKEAGVGVGEGILVDEYLRTSQPDIYAAGDVAEFFNPALGKRLRVEHEDNANQMGITAGKNMAGVPVPYHHLPFFYSDLFELGYEAIGELDPTLDVIVDWKKPYQEGVLYYLKDDRVRGVLLWNTWGKVEAARSLIGKDYEKAVI